MMWTVSEDAVLKAGMTKYGINDWRTVSASMFNHRRSWRECKERFEVLTEKPWTHVDDARLREAVSRFGLHVQWATVAAIMKRPLQSCRHRFFLQESNHVPSKKIGALKAKSTKICKATWTSRRGNMKPKIDLR